MGRKRSRSDQTKRGRFRGLSEGIPSEVGPEEVQNREGGGIPVPTKADLRVSTRKKGGGKECQGEKNRNRTSGIRSPGEEPVFGKRGHQLGESQGPTQGEKTILSTKTDCYPRRHSVRAPKCTKLHEDDSDEGLITEVLENASCENPPRGKAAQLTGQKRVEVNPWLVGRDRYSTRAKNVRGRTTRRGASVRKERRPRKGFSLKRGRWQGARVSRGVR